MSILDRTHPETLRPGVLAARLGDLLHYVALLALALFCATPIVVMFATSFKLQSDLFTQGLHFVFVPTLQNYRDVLFDDHFDRYLVNSLVVGVASTAITLLLGCMAAYGLVRLRFRGRKAIGYTTLLLRTVPLAVLAVPVFMVWTRAGIANSLGGLVLLYVAVNLPFTIWLLYGFIQQVPVELEEAAAIDGCGPLAVFWRVVLPLIRPGLAAAAIFTFRIAWNEFILALVLTDRATRTLPVAASLYVTDIGVDWGKVMALGSLIAIPPLVFTFLAARQIITGLTAGAVKG
ncbi:carbohydrate ABC transporter permease [Xylophilus ampelinus]|uniref:Carbohydrate ABC transporter membrane protein 2 (CUT1 family) n=1 Tax=Xylophilus ampelinus TaxID=54067 RepID=A0A318T0U8_9BURK|nr:carbohydrate ABC transporter permease [Xylophilus ampelinus]MCS4509411.1 carbohydrate ABC transporter permease [Xylophilus ampelinus]PYE79133.1 carbohydrate ABC transporter membrane protein 2 (CUT1 family) [Xylophilus ampelinus]